MTPDQLALVALTVVGLALVVFGFVLGVLYSHSFDNPFSWLGAARFWYWKRTYGHDLRSVAPPERPQPRSCVRVVRDENGEARVYPWGPTEAVHLLFDDEGAG